MKKLNLSTRLYTIYHHKIYPRFKHLRGFTKAIGVFRKLAELRIEKVEETEAENIFERGDWDNLVILDACRYDIYSEIVSECEKRVTLSGNSPEFIESNFSHCSDIDITYVSACYFFAPDKFRAWTGKDLDEVFEKVRHFYEESWDSELNTVMPESVLEAALEEKDQSNRMIIHFAQPHNPFVNYDFETDLPGMYGYPSASEGKLRNVWELGQIGELSREQIRRGYESNLRFVMDYVNRLVDQLEGKTVVTSDHGELLGETGMYGHFYGSNSRPVRLVPWHIMNE